MPRTHYIVRLSKRALVPGRSLTFGRGEEIPASVTEVRTEDYDEAERIAHGRPSFDGDLTRITKVHRNGDQEVVSSGFNGSGFASPEERQRLDIGDVLDFVARLAAAGNEEAQALLAKHDGSCLAKGA
jgi:hypothetical protein